MIKIGHHKIGAWAWIGQNRIRGGWGVQKPLNTSDIIYVRSLTSRKFLYKLKTQTKVHLHEISENKRKKYPITNTRETREFQPKSKSLFGTLCFVHPISLSFGFWYFGNFCCVIFFLVFSVLPNLPCITFLYFCKFLTKLTKNEKRKMGSNERSSVDSHGL